MGLSGLENKSTRPKSQANETPIRITERIIEMRHENKLCAQKLWYKLRKENVDINVRTIGKIIKSEKLVRKYCALDGLTTNEALARVQYLYT